jgi:hypothetical protein
MFDKSKIQKNKRLARNATGRKPIKLILYLNYLFKMQYFTFSCNIDFFFCDFRFRDSLVDFHGEFFGICQLINHSFIF